MNQFRVILVVLILTALISGVLPFGEPPATAAEGEEQDLPPLELAKKGNPKLDSHLNQLVDSKMRGKAASFAEQRKITLADDRVKVIIECQPGQADNVTGAASGLGASVEARYHNLVQAVVPVNALDGLANNPAARFIRLPHRFLPAVISQGVGLINADEWQAENFTGAGVKVAVLDPGFAGYTSLLGTELPASVTAVSFSGDITGGGQPHGTACAEVIYDIAPDAQFYLVNFDTEVELGNAFDYLISQGVHIISVSFGDPIGGPGDGTGVMNEMVAEARAAGILVVVAMGNYAQRHWQGDFVDTNGNSYHDFSTSPLDEGNSIYVSAWSVILVCLKWDDPWGASSNNYDLLLKNQSGENVAGSVDIQNGDDDPVECFSYIANDTGYYYIAIGKASATRNVNFHLYSIYHDLEYRVTSSSLFIPADSPNALSVGAVPWNNPTTLESFSSRGPTKDGHIKPDLVAPDGVSNVTYGSFSGTSASAPHGAGAAVLVKQRYPSYSPAQIQAFLEGRAIDMGSAGKDNLYGSGRLYMGYLPPVADFTANITSGYAPLAVAFTDNSTGNITGWSWNFGDGGNSTAQNPVHQYTAAGSHTVSLAVTGPGGTDNRTRASYITVAPGPLHHVVVIPSSANVTMTCNLTFSAAGKDLYGNTISGLGFTWSVDNATAGTIVATSNTTARFTAGLTLGTYPNTVKATCVQDTNYYGFASVTVTLPSMTVNISLQGPERTAAQLTVPFLVKLFSENVTLTWQNILTAVPAANFTTSDWPGSGNITIGSVNATSKQLTLTVSGVVPGRYNMTIVSPHNLVNLRNGVEITLAGLTVNMGTLQEGNADDSYKIDIGDFGILAVAYRARPTDGNWDARADFNRSLQVTIADFSLLAMNFNETSPITVTG